MDKTLRSHLTGAVSNHAGHLCNKYRYTYVGLYTYMGGSLWIIMATHNALSEDMTTRVVRQKVLTMKRIRDKIIILCHSATTFKRLSSKLGTRAFVRVIGMCAVYDIIHAYIIRQHIHTSRTDVWPISKTNLIRKHFKIFAKFTNEISFDKHRAE